MRVRRRPLRFTDLLVALVIAGIASTVGVAVVLDSAELFALVHAQYLAIVLTVPLIGAWGLATSLVTRSGRVVQVLSAALVLPAVLGLYMTHVEPSWLRVDQIDVQTNTTRQGEGPMRIGVLADLQTTGVGTHEQDAIDSLMELEPDVIVLPGDIYQGDGPGFDATLPEVAELLSRLSAPGGVYLVTGDVDGGGRSQRVAEAAGIELLDDRVVRIDVGGRQVLLGGTALDVRSPGAAAVRSELLAEPADGATTVLVSHRPDTVLELPPESRVDLTIAGHTHGGQVVVPGFGPPLTLTDVPRTVARGGLHQVDGNTIYVSPGVGLERAHAPQLRLFNRPAVAVLALDS